MDEQSFDTLSRRLAGVRTRRQAIKAIAGAVVASVAGDRAAEAQQCTAHYSPCTGDGQCCAGAVCEYGLCMPGCRIDGGFTSAWMSPPDTICAQCRPELSTTSWTPANEGMSCWSGDPGAGVTACQAGACTPVMPQSCPPPTACHLEGEVDPITGRCVNPPAPAGTRCGNPAMCHGEFFSPADACDGNGFCISGGSQTVPCAPYQCGEGSCTRSCESDNDCAASAHCDDGACFPDADLGQPCDEDSDCLSGICAEGICCNQRCAGLCETCVGATPGVCRPVVCDDGLSCTSGVCDETTGACTHTLNAGTCLIAGQCAPAGTVNPENACQVCNPTADPHAWSAVVCDDGLSCTSATCDPVTGCGQSINAGFCLIDGVCYEDETVNTANACQVCDPDVDAEGWSDIVCATDEACFQGACASICASNADCTSGICYQGVCVTSISGALTTGSGQGDCSCATCYRDVYTVTHLGGPIQIGMRGAGSGSGTLNDPFLGLFSSFSGTCANRLAYADDEGCGTDALLSLDNLDAGTYAVVASSFVFGTEGTGTYTLTFGQGAGC